MLDELDERFGGEVPCDENELKSLPGVGNYIARAVLVFGCGKIAPLLDTNTVRIAGRYFGMPVTDSSRRSRRFENLVMYLIDISHPAESYYALLDLGALICTPRSPKCDYCPLNDHCQYYRHFKRKGNDNQRPENNFEGNTSY